MKLDMVSTKWVNRRRDDFNVCGAILLLEVDVPPSNLYVARVVLAAKGHHAFFLTLSRAQGEEEGKDNRNSAAAATACRRCFCGHATAAWRQCASQENGYVETAPVPIGAALCESPCWQRQGAASGPLPLRSFGASRVGSHVCSRAQHELFKLDSTQSVVTAFLCSNSFRIDSELFKLDSTQPVVAALLCPKLLGDFASAYDFV